MTLMRNLSTLEEMGDTHMEEVLKIGGGEDRILVGIFMQKKDEENIMVKNIWKWIKENVAVIVTVATAMVAVTYAALRLCMYAYWKGYFMRLNIDVNIMDLNFDKSIYAVIFVSIILFVVIFFMNWVCDIIDNIKIHEKERQLKGVKKLIRIPIMIGKGLVSSAIILSIVNIPLIMLIVSVVRIRITIANVFSLLLLLYVVEMFFTFIQMMNTKKYENRGETTERMVAFIITEILVLMLIILSAAFYGGNQAIDKRNSAQLVENEEYMITYCDGEYYVLHKVDYNDEKVVIYRNEQKIVSVENCEVSIKQIKEVEVID